MICFGPNLVEMCALSIILVYYDYNQHY